MTESEVVRSLIRDVNEQLKRSESLIEEFTNSGRLGLVEGEKQRSKLLKLKQTWLVIKLGETDSDSEEDENFLEDLDIKPRKKKASKSSSKKSDNKKENEEEEEETEKDTSS